VPRLRTDVDTPRPARSRVGRRLSAGAAALGASVLGLLAASLVLPVASASATGPTVTGSGSSYAAIAIDQWVSQVATLYGDNINYSTQSSVIGLNQFAAQQVDMGASEIGYSTNQANQTPPAGYPYQYMPDVAGAECLDYNLQGSTSQTITNLNLTPAVIGEIFTGVITKWNDPQLVALNPSALLPSTSINLVYRADASGDNYIMSDYIETVDPGAWNPFTSAVGTPAGAQAIWPFPANTNRVPGHDLSNWISQNGSDGSSNYVYGNPNTITYVEDGYAKLHHDPCANVQNASGAFLQPSSLADAIALTNDQLSADLEQNLTPVFESPQAGAYPISAYSYLITPEGQIDPAKGQVMGRFILYLACEGQNAAGALGYSPLPPNLVQDDFTAVAKIAGNTGANAPPASPTAANCKNPYVDGAIPLVGQPVVQGQTGGGPAAAASTGPAAAATGPAAAASTAPGAAGPGGGTSAAAASTTTVAGATAAAHTAVTAVKASSPPGQIPGVALNSAVGRLLGVPAPTLEIIGVTLLFLAIVLAPPFIALGRRRRADASLGGDDPGSAGPDPQGGTPS